MEDSYSVLARHYDSLMADTDYAGYADFYESAGIFLCIRPFYRECFVTLLRGVQGILRFL